MEWQPIETAPKDGTEFCAWLVTQDGHEFWEPRCHFDEDGRFGVYGRIDYDIDGWDYDLFHLTPTHYMIIEPPKDHEADN